MVKKRDGPLRAVHIKKKKKKLAENRAIQNYCGLVVEIVGVRLNNPLYMELQFHDIKGFNLLTKAPLH